VLAALPPRPACRTTTIERGRGMLSDAKDCKGSPHITSKMRNDVGKGMALGEQVTVDLFVTLVRNR
jgi:hypothetical protein